MTGSIFVTLSSFSEYDSAPLRMLETSGIPFALNKSGRRVSRTELVETASDATVVVAGVEAYDAATLSRLQALRCISRCGAGIDAIDLAEARSRDITVLNTPDAPTQAVAELAVAMILALSRNLMRQSNSLASREWTRLESHLIAGRRIGLIGLGRIGRRVVELFTPFMASFAAHDPYADAEWAASHSVELVSLEELLVTSDVVSVHAARSADHPLRLGAPEFASMRRGALVVNVARGSMLDEEALHEALASGHLAGAGLDVFAEEPYSGALCDLPQVVLTPHCATSAVETRVAMEIECVTKAIAFVQGRLRPEDRVL